MWHDCRTRRATLATARCVLVNWRSLGSKSDVIKRRVEMARSTAKSSTPLTIQLKRVRAGGCAKRLSCCGCQRKRVAALAQVLTAGVARAHLPRACFRARPSAFPAGTAVERRGGVGSATGSLRELGEAPYATNLYSTIVYGKNLFCQESRAEHVGTCGSRGS